MADSDSLHRPTRFLQAKQRGEINVHGTVKYWMIVTNIRTCVRERGMIQYNTPRGRNEYWVILTKRKRARGAKQLTCPEIRIRGAPMSY